jgi:allantoinase
MMTEFEHTGHAYYNRVPICARPPLQLPYGARVALAIVVSAEYYEMQPPDDAFTPPNVPGGFGRGPYPDYRSWSARAYGNRVGIFRVLESLARYRLQATVAVDMLTAQHCAFLMRFLDEGGWEIAAHGQSVNRVVSSQMSEEQERRYVRACLDVLERTFDVIPAGWHGPEYGESAFTPALLAEQGLKYVLDWPNDEQPISLSTPKGPLVSLPMMIDFDDVYAQLHRRLDTARWCSCVEEGLDQMINDGGKSGRILILNIHPWLTGHPFRMTYFDEMLERILRKKGIWFTSAGEIARWWVKHKF